MVQSSALAVARLCLSHSAHTRSADAVARVIDRYLTPPIDGQRERHSESSDVREGQRSVGTRSGGLVPRLVSHLTGPDTATDVTHLTRRTGTELLHMRWIAPRGGPGRARGTRLGSLVSETVGKRAPRIGSANQQAPSAALFSRFGVARDRIPSHPDLVVYARSTTEHRPLAPRSRPEFQRGSPTLSHAVCAVIKAPPQSPAPAPTPRRTWRARRPSPHAPPWSAAWRRASRRTSSTRRACAAP